MELENNSGFTPNGDLILVKPIEPPETSAGGIVLIQATKDAEAMGARIGYVVDIGEDAALHPRMRNIVKGTMILFNRYAQDMWVVAKEKYFIMRAEAVMGPTTKMPDYMLSAARASAEVFGVGDHPEKPWVDNSNHLTANQ